MKSILVLFLAAVVFGAGSMVYFAHEDIPTPQGKAEKVISNDRFLK